MQLLPNGKQQFVDQNGAPLANGSVYYYFTDTSAYKATYKDQAALATNTNPVLLDSSGQAVIWGSGNYRQVVKDSSGVVIWDQFISAPDFAGQIIAQLAGDGGVSLVGNAVDKRALAATSGSALVGTPSGATLQATLNRNPSRLGRSSGADLPRFMAMLRGYRNDQFPIIPIVGFGSSVGVGATLVTPAVDAPVAWFKSQLKARIDQANIYNLTAYNYCVNGSSASEFPTAYAAMIAAGITQPGIAVLCYGMNDQQPALFNSGQTFPGFYAGMRTAITTLKKAGWDVVVMTTPHASIVLNPSINSMPSVVPQIYPTSIAAPVGAEQMQPAASLSNVIADFIGEGVSITVSHRALRVNQAMRDVCKEFGATLIDTERYWFEALQKFQLQTGSAAGAEGILFNSSETVHPNLVGHQNSYQASVNDFVKSLAWQASQPNVAPRMNGYYGYNLADTLPTSVIEVRTPYPDLVAPPMKVWARTGLVDANSIRTEEVAIQVDPATGDLVLGDQTASNGSWRFGVARSTDHLQTDHLYRVGKCYGVTFTELIEGSINVQIATPYVTRTAFPANSTGVLTIVGSNTGVGTSPQVSKFQWKTNATTVTLIATGTDIGSGVFTAVTSGLLVSITAVANNTNFQVRWEALGA